ncbi:MAG: hypothetical protein HFE63_06190 [Clostridiales bacterium]|nr:hypothetical protein [Clostridiales bacterium]
MEENTSKIRLGSEADTHKLKLLVTIVNREKAEFYLDFIQNFEVNMQIAMLGHGTANTETLQLLGLAETDKAVLLGTIRSDRAGEALAALENKFKTLKNGKGIAFTVPLTSTIGVSLYRFLSNNRKGADSKWNSHTK